MSGAFNSVGVNLFKAVQGLKSIANDVLYHSPMCTSLERTASHVIFFGGDVQNLREMMKAHRDNWRYEEWCLENTCQLLSTKFKYDHIWVVCANSMFLNTFAMYEFLPAGPATTPEHSTEGTCVEHLSQLLENGLKTITEESSDKFSDLSKCPIKLVAFSKGCTVLNQILYELNKTDEICRRFLEKVRFMYWLDGGHSGGKNTWVSDEECLTEVPKKDIKVRVHVSPYQVDDPNRAWVGKEERKFVSKLRKLGANIEETKHFEDVPPSIENHFKVLNSFTPDE